MTKCPGLSGTVPVLPWKVPRPRKRLCPGESQDDWLTQRDTWPVPVTRSCSPWPEKREGMSEWLGPRKGVLHRKPERGQGLDEKPPIGFVRNSNSSLAAEDHRTRLQDKGAVVGRANSFLVEERFFLQEHTRAPQPGAPCGGLGCHCSVSRSSTSCTPRQTGIGCRLQKRPTH